MQTFRERHVLLVVQDAEIPGDFQKEFQCINPRKRAPKRSQFFVCSLVARGKKQFKHLDETGVYLFAQGIAGLLRKMITITKPQLVGSEHALNDREHLRERNVFVHSYDRITSTENLLAAWREFVAGKRMKPDVQAFGNALMDNILALHGDFASGRYLHGPYVAFGISDPKPRRIHKASVRDRLVHHAIYRQLYPFFDRTFIADSYSCRDRKGTHRAMDRFRRYAWKASKNHTRTCWVLKCDIRKFFASIDQGILISILKRYILDDRVVGLLENIIGSFHSTGPGKGLPLGNLTSQLLVNIYMNEFDQFVKHRLKTKHYIRYADDFVFLSPDRSELEEWLPAVSEFLKNRLELSLHPDKVFISTIASGVDFLGWVHFPDHRVIRSATRRRMEKNLAAGRNKAKVQSYRGLLSHGNAKRISRVLEIDSKT